MSDVITIRRSSEPISLEWPTLLIVHPNDVETPPERLKISVHTKVRGYLSEAYRDARRVTDRHVAPGDGYLVSLGSLPGF